MLRVLSFGVFAASWEIGSRLAGARYLPAPLDVLHRLVVEAQSGGLFFHLGVTLLRVAAAKAFTPPYFPAHFYIEVAARRARQCDED